MQTSSHPSTIRKICLLLMMIGWQVSYSQLIYINAGRDIYSFDPITCDYTLVVSTAHGFLDIAFDRHGNLYGCNSDLVRIYLSTGSLMQIVDFGTEVFNGMTISHDDIAYLGSPNGSLYSYDFNTAVTKYHGNMGFGCSGDFTFYKGELYMAAFDNQIVKVNIDHPELSELVLTHPSASDIVGIVSDYRGCDDTRVYGLTIGSNTEIYQIDIENRVAEFVCQIPLGVLGGASTTEFLASIPVTLGEPLIIPPDCKTLTGMISFPSALGMGEMTFRMDDQPWQQSSEFGPLQPGHYLFFMMDDRGCLDSLNIDLQPYPLIVINDISVVQPFCNQSDGVIHVSAEGGTGVLTYSLNGMFFLLPSTFSGLPAGDYTVYIKDNSGCIVEQSVSLEDHFFFDTTKYDIQHTTCGLDNGGIFLYPDVGSDFRFAIDGKGFQEESTFSDLSAGMHQIVIKSPEGCYDTLFIELEVLEPPKLLVIDIGPESCDIKNGYVDGGAIGGIAPFSYRLNNSVWQANSTFDHLLADQYTLYLQDGRSCLDSAEIVVDKINGPQIDHFVTQPSACSTANGSVDIEWSSESGGGTLSLFNEEGQQIDQLVNLSAGFYQLTLIDDSGCRLDTFVTINAIDCNLYIPTIFSPNGDGINDRFVITMHPGSDERLAYCSIFDRWGSQVYFSGQPIDAEATIDWDGLVNGKECAPGVYTYILTIFNHVNREHRGVYGTVTLIK